MTTTNKEQHICPYAAALSDDEDASFLNSSNSSTSLQHTTSSDGIPSQQHTTSPTSLHSSILNEAKLKCPAFTNSKCPFREVGSNPEAMMEIMKTVPPSHFPNSGNSKNNDIRSEEGAGSLEGTTPFQLAMEHVHNVSSLLDAAAATNSSLNSDNNVTVSPEKRDGFIIKGGCPFKSYHQQSNSKSSSSKKHLAKAMEDFSISAIMGRMASVHNLDEFNGLRDSDKMEEGDAEELLRLLSFSPEKKIKEADTEEVTPQVGDSTVQQGQTDPSTEAENDTPPPSQQQEQQEEPRTSLLSQALKTGTAESHTAAENLHFVNNFIQGKIDRELYIELVTGLYHTYVTLESLLDEYAPKYFPSLYFPTELSRRVTLEEDMEYWHGLNWKNKVECNTPTPAVQDYIDRMVEVGKLDPLLLLSHAYTRYLGDLSGGKVLSRIARRALNLGKGYDGLQFYNFDYIKSAKLFKDKYRDALDELVLTSSEIGKLVAEANVAFALNMRVFEELDVKGGVEGARVRNVREALSYYDIEMEQQKLGRSGSQGTLVDLDDDGEEEKCPFGFKSGPNPHKKNVKTKKDIPPSTPSLSLSLKQEHAEKGGRCPWPFVFFHDPVMGMKDWQTWFVIGLILCWCWSSFNV